jgi:hypothetical protein
VIYSLSLALPWRPLAAALSLAPVLALACLLPLPETPYWLARQARPEEAASSLAWLRGGQDCAAELQEILETPGRTGEPGGVGAAVARRARLLVSRSRPGLFPSPRRFLAPMLVAGPLFLLYQVSGFSIIGFYLVTVLEQADVALPPLQARAAPLSCHEL